MFLRVVFPEESSARCLIYPALAVWPLEPVGFFLFAFVPLGAYKLGPQGEIFSLPVHLFTKA